MQPLELPDIVAAMKSLPQIPAWSVEDGGRLSMVMAVDIDGLTIEGLRFRLKAHQEFPDKFVTAQLEYAPPKGNVSGGPLCRIEWRPLRAHSNHGIGPKEWRFMPQAMTHHHRFDLNWAHSNAATRRGNLPIAVPVDPDPPDLGAFVDLVSTEFRIADLGSVAVPPWEKKLL